VVGGRRALLLLLLLDDGDRGLAGAAASMNSLSSLEKRM
jgi:hypothetical protein